MKLPFASFVKRHHVSRAALSLGVIVAALVFFVAGAMLRLLMGPVSLGPLRGPIAEAIRQAMPGITLQYDQAAVEWSREQGKINLVVLGARMFDANGRIVAQAPKADVDLAARPFLSGRFVVQRITLVGVQLALVRMMNGGIRLGVAADKGGDDIIQRLSDIINKNSGGPSSLESFAVRDARLAIYDEPTGLFLVAPRAALVIRSRGEAIAAAFNADVEISGRRAHLTADVTLPPKNAPISGTLTVRDLDLRALAANTQKFAALRNVALTTSLTSQFRFGADAKLAEASFDLTAKGEMPFGVYRSKILHVNNARLAGRYEGAANRVSVTTADLETREVRAKLTAQGDLVYGPDGKLAQIKGGLNATSLTVAVPGFFAQDTSFDSLNLAGMYDIAARKLDVVQASLTAPSFRMETAGVVTLADNAAPGLALSGTLGQMPFRMVMRYWPLVIAPGARSWVAGNIFAGTVGPADFTLNMAPGVLDKPVLPADALKLTFNLRDAEANYLSGLTHLTGVNGSIVLTADDLLADFSGGRVGNLIVKSGRAVIPALQKDGTIGTFTARVEGVMPDIMTLIDMKPLNYPTRFNVDPRQTRGNAGVDLNIRVPMLSDISVDDVGISIKASVSDFAVTRGKLQIRDGDVTFDIDNNRLKQSGTVMLADQRFTVDWTEDFKTTENVTTRLNARGLFTPAVRDVLNIDIGKVMTGSWPATASITGHRFALLQAEATLDLAPAVISVPFVNLGKAAGESASARVTVNFTPDGQVSDQTFRVSGVNMSATGTAIFDRQGRLARLDFTNVRRGALNDLAFTLTKEPNGDVYDVRGRVLDGSAIGRAASCNTPAGGPRAAPKPDEKPEGNYRVIARLERLALCDNVSITDLSFDLSGSGDRPSALSMSGKIGTANITAALTNVPQGRRVTINAGDAGLLARALFGFKGLSGGTLNIVATLPGRAGDPDAAANVPDFQGNLTLTDFKMVNQAFLARLFSAVSFTGFGDLLQNEGISMDRFEVPFSSKNNVIAINGAIFTGGVGGTADGYIDRPKAHVAVKGSLIPAYGLNSFISNVPLLGDLLASKKGEGIFGVTYSMNGPTDNLSESLSYNPLSMLAPGILRRLFEGKMPTAANAPSNQAAPPAAGAAGSNQ